MGGENGEEGEKDCQGTGTHGQSQRGVGSREGGGGVRGVEVWWGGMETTVIEQQ